jgi:hypothetical protein
MLDWQANGVRFTIDDVEVFTTSLTPRAPLALVLWIDNQFAAWRPDGTLASGALKTSADCWLEIKNITLT